MVLVGAPSDDNCWNIDVGLGGVVGRGDEVVVDVVGIEVLAGGVDVL